MNDAERRQLEIQALEQRLAELERPAELERERDEARVQLAKMTEWRDKADRQHDKERDRANTAEAERDAAQATAAMLREACQLALDFGATTPEEWNAAAKQIRAALSTPGSDWLAEQRHAAQRVGRDDARRAFIDMLDGAMVLAGEATWRPVFDAIASRLASERCAAQSEAKAEVASAFDKAFGACVPFTLGVGPTAEDFARSRLKVLREFGLRVAIAVRSKIGSNFAPADVVEHALATEPRATEAKPACAICGAPSTCFDMEHTCVAHCPNCAKEPR